MLRSDLLTLLTEAFDAVPEHLLGARGRIASALEALEIEDSAANPECGNCGMRESAWFVTPVADRERYSGAALGCPACSETLRIVDANEVERMLNAATGRFL